MFASMHTYTHTLPHYLQRTLIWKPLMHVLSLLLQPDPPLTQKRTTYDEITYDFCKITFSKNKANFENKVRRITNHSKLKESSS